MKINIASTGGFQYSIPGSARNRKPRGDSILVGGYLPGQEKIMTSTVHI